MTDTLTRPASSQPRAGAARPQSVVVSGVVAAIGAAALGLLTCLSIVVLGWATDPNSSGTSAGLVRAAGQLWLLSHRAPLVAGGETITLAPLGLTAVIFVLIARAAGGTAGRTRGSGFSGAVAAALAIAVPYALVVAVVAAGAQTEKLRTQPVRALAAGFVVALVAAFAGAARRIGWQETSQRWPLPLRNMPAAVGVAMAIVVGTGAVLVAGALLADASRVSALARSIEGAGPAGLALLVVQIALAPNAAIWGSAYAAGTGFAVGIGTHVGPAGSVVGAVPALPLLAALPASGPGASVGIFSVGWISVAGLIVAGAASGIVFARRIDGTPQHLTAVWMAATALAGGATFALLCWLSGGSGPGRLSPLGPQPAASGAVVALWLALSGVPAAWITSWRQVRHAEFSRVTSGR